VWGISGHNLTQHCQHFWHPQAGDLLLLRIQSNLGTLACRNVAVAAAVAVRHVRGRKCRGTRVRKRNNHYQRQRSALGTVNGRAYWTSVLENVRH
jgi:hypothetical protein